MRACLRCVRGPRALEQVWVRTDVSDARHDFLDGVRTELAARMLGLAVRAVVQAAYATERLTIRD